MYIYSINKKYGKYRNARIARNEIIAPCRKRKKVRRVKGQGGGRILKNCSPSFRISEK